MERDPRVTALETSLCDVAWTVARMRGFSTDGHGDVLTYHADVRSPMFNAIVGSDLAGRAVARRVREILAPYLDRGQPFMWWPLPSSTSVELEQELRTAGMEIQLVTGMHLTLDGGAARQSTEPPRRRALPMMPDDYELLLGSALSGAHIAQLAPRYLTPLMGYAYGDSVVRRWAGAVFGAAWMTGPIVGLYGLHRMPDRRDRKARTLCTALLGDALERGCLHAVVHATMWGRPIFERLGFVDVCDMSYYVWRPS